MHLPHMRAFAIVWLILVFLSKPAWACSVEEGYRTPTNFELVQTADLIILARVLDGPHEIAGLGEDEQKLVIKTERVLKGEPPATEPPIYGAVVWNGKHIPPMPTTLNKSHFSAGLGACVRIFYPKNTLVVAMFERGPDGYLQIGSPWARSIEDVDGLDDIWVKAVREYLDIQEGASADAMRQLVRQRIEVLSAQKESIAAQAMAHDLQYYLDVTAGEPHQDGAHWVHVDTPTESALLIGSEESGEVLLCRAGEPSIVLDSFGRPNISQLQLQFGDEIFAVEGESVATRSAGFGADPVTVISGTIPFTTDVARQMTQVAAPVALTSEEGELHSAAPLDAFVRFASRCEALLRPR